MHALWSNYISSNTPDFSDSFDAEANNNLVLLPKFGVLQLHGEKTADFLQGYLTCNTAKLSSSRALFGAMCDIKGRVIANFYLLEIQGVPSFVVRTSVMEHVKSHLERYLVFSKCQLRNVSDEFVILGRIRAARQTPLANQLQVAGLPGKIELEVDDRRQLLLCTPETAIELWSAADVHLNDRAWELADLRAGIIMIGSDFTGQHLPQSLNMTGENGSVDFNKGCYLGQEIIARVEHRGSLKRRLSLFSWTTAVEGPPVTGEDIINSEGKTCGQVAHTVEIVPGEGLLLGVVRLQDNSLISDAFKTATATLGFLNHAQELT